jgi:hypothetical protein
LSAILTCKASIFLKLKLSFICCCRRLIELRFLLRNSCCHSLSYISIPRTILRPSCVWPALISLYTFDTILGNKMIKPYCIRADQPGNHVWPSRSLNLIYQLFMNCTSSKIHTSTPFLAGLQRSDPSF